MLDIDGLRLQQSLAIIEYLEERNPEPALLPPRGRRAALAQLIACEVHPLNNLRALKRLRTQFGADDEQVGEWYRHWCHEAFSAFEAALGDDDGSPYALGDAPGIVECFLMPQVYNARRYGADRRRMDGSTPSRGPRRPASLPGRQPRAPARRAAARAGRESRLNRAVPSQSGGPRALLSGAAATQETNHANRDFRARRRRRAAAAR